MKEYQDTFELKAGLSMIADPDRNLPVLEEAIGCFPDTNGLITHEAATVNVAPIACSFPYPQWFSLREVTVVCYATSIYEVIGGVETFKLGGLTSGLPWSVADFYQYLVLTNGKVTVHRDPLTRVYSIADLPAGNSCINLNGQLLFGAPSRV